MYVARQEKETVFTDDHARSKRDCTDIRCHGENKKGDAEKRVRATGTQTERRERERASEHVEEA